MGRIEARSSAVSLAVVMLLCTGCAQYATPYRAADMSVFGVVTAEQRQQMTDAAIARVLERQPLAEFPAGIAYVRVQEPGYKSYKTDSYGTGRYSIVLTRTVERDEDIERLAALPMVHGLGPLNRLLLPTQLRDDKDLRQAAAGLHADILLIYTFDTTIRIGDNTSPVDLVTLGFLPHKKAHVATTASAVLMDTRNGYVYGVAEASADHDQFANTWTTEEAVDQSRLKTEAEAFQKLVGELERTWTGVVRQYALPPDTPDAPSES
jgi:hypothetical protein